MTAPIEGAGRRPASSAWFTRDRFGLFIHWGLYSLAGRDFGHQREQRMSAEEYRGRYLPRFDPDLFDPEAWADCALAAGTKYVVIVAKHHEGFCLWDSKLTDYTAVNSPARRDLLRPILDAFRSRGFRTGIYYSLIDWHHPDFTVDLMHPLAEANRVEANRGRDMARYRDFMKGQIRELMTGYGHIDVFWPDYCYDAEAWQARASDPRNAEAFKDAVRNGPSGLDFDSEPGKGATDWGSQELLGLVRELQPHILVNDRLGVPGDFITPEQAIPITDPPGRSAVPWETCETLYGSWGYRQAQPELKSVDQLVTMLIDVVSRGGNLLLNVGPTGRGEFDQAGVERLHAVGAWMSHHGRSILGCTQAPADLRASIPPGTLATYNPATSRLYVHLLRWPTQPLVLPGLAGRVTYAQFLHDSIELVAPASALKQFHAPPPGDLWLDLPTVRPDVVVPVLELFLDEHQPRSPAGGLHG